MVYQAVIPPGDLVAKLGPPRIDIMTTQPGIRQCWIEGQGTCAPYGVDRTTCHGIVGMRSRLEATG